MQKARRAENQFINAAERQVAPTTKTIHNCHWLSIWILRKAKYGKEKSQSTSASLNRKLKKVTSENEELKVQKERYRKRLQRINGQNTFVLSCSSVSAEETDEFPSASTEVLTPRCKTMGEIRATGVSPRNLPKPIRRKLLASNIFIWRNKRSCTSRQEEKFSFEKYRSW